MAVRPGSSGRARQVRRRLSVIVLSPVLLFAMLSACGGAADPVSAVTAPTSATTASASTVPTTPASTSAPEPTPAPEPAPEPVTPAPEPTPEPTPEPPPPPAPPAVDPMTGGAPMLTPVVAAKIDNTASGQPQYGLAVADIVYVEEVEAGLTRLLAVFHTVLPDEVGPVRSVRTTDGEILSGYGIPILAFSGGAGGPLAALQRSGAIDGSGVSGVYWRSGAARAPYNLHANLAQLAASIPGWTAPKDLGMVFAATDGRVEAAPPADGVTAKFPTIRQTFTYADGRYRVGRNGDPLSDAEGTPVVADNVLVQNVQSEPDGTVDSVGSPSYVSHTVGNGTFSLYRDGHVLTGTWNRPAADQPTSYLDAAGVPVPFKPGRTWVVLATPSTTVD